MKKKITALCLAVAMLAVAVIGGTLAYFTDTDEAKNVFTVGSIDIVLHEDNALIGDPAYAIDEGYRTWLTKQTIVPGVPVEKDAWVENTGKNDAYVRVVVTVPDHLAPVWDSDFAQNWTIESTTTDANGATVYTLTYNDVLAKSGVTPDFLTAVQMDKYYNEKPENLANMTMTVAINVQAIQADGFTNAAAAFAALDQQILFDDTTVTKISTAEDLLALAGKNVEGRYFLTNDIDLGGAELATIGVTYNKSFELIGAGNTISNAKLVTGKQNGMTNIGMFYVETDATFTVSDLTLSNVTVEDGVDEYTIGAAALIGYANERSVVTLNNVDVKDSIVNNTKGNAAGLIGYVCAATVKLTDCDVIGLTASSEKIEKLGAFIGTVNQDHCVVYTDNCLNGTDYEDFGRVINGAVVDGAGTKVAIVSTADGLIQALENNKGVVLTGDVKIEPASMSSGYGTTGINVKNGQMIDGNGNTLDIKGAGGTWDSGINTTGGVIKNITVTGSFRGIFINHNSTHSERVILENVVIDGTTYTISCDQGSNQGLTATNSTFNGWTSYAATLGEAEFINCSFGEGNGYAFCRPYAPTKFVNCVFEAGYQVDPRAAVTFENCYIGGVLITADNLGTLVTSNIANASVK